MTDRSKAEELAERLRDEADCYIDDSNGQNLLLEAADLLSAPPALSQGDREKLEEVAARLLGNGPPISEDQAVRFARSLRSIASRAPSGGEDARLAAFEALTEGNFFSFTDPEHQEEYVWQIVDAVIDAAISQRSEEER